MTGGINNDPSGKFNYQGNNFGSQNEIEGDGARDKKILTYDQLMALVNELRSLAGDIFSKNGETGKDGFKPPPLGGNKKIDETSAMHCLNNLDDSGMADLMDFMAVFNRLAQLMRNAQRAARQAETQSQVNTMLNAADKMLEAAKTRLIAGLVEGSMQMASGFVQVGIATVAATKAANSLNTQKKAGEVEDKITEIKDMSSKSGAGMDKAKTEAMNELETQQGALTEKASVLHKQSEYLNSVREGVGTILTGATTTTKTPIEYAANVTDAERSKLDAAAKVHETAAQNANEMFQQMQDIMRDIREKLQSIQQAQIEANRGIARNI